MTPFVSLVMPCHNRREALILTLSALCRQTYPAEQLEVIVVDQASNDGSRDVARSLDVPYTLRLIEQDAKYGPAAARNAGIGDARGTILILLDSDLLPDLSLVEEHVKEQLAQGSVLASGRILAYQPAYTGFIDRIAAPEHALDRGQCRGLIPFWNAFSGNLSLTREVSMQVGPFDSQLRSYEDIDFAYRALRAGIRIVSCPEAIAYHNHPRTLDERCNQARAYDQMVPVLLDRYPELGGQLPFARDFETVNLLHDGPTQLYRKLRLRFLALATVRAGLYWALVLLERHEWLPLLAKPLFWRLIQANRFVGFREGRLWLSNQASQGSV